MLRYFPSGALFDMWAMETCFVSSVSVWKFPVIFLLLNSTRGLSQSEKTRYFRTRKMVDVCVLAQDGTLSWGLRGLCRLLVGPSVPQTSAGSGWFVSCLADCPPLAARPGQECWALWLRWWTHLCLLSVLPFCHVYLVPCRLQVGTRRGSSSRLAELTFRHCPLFSFAPGNFPGSEVFFL